MSAGRPERAGQRSFELLLLCGFSENCWHFPGCRPPPSLEHMLHRTPPQRLHIWSQVAQTCGGVTCLIEFAYKLTSSTEDSGTARLQPFICPRFCLGKLPTAPLLTLNVVLTSHPQSQLSSTHSGLEKVLCSLAITVVSAPLLVACSPLLPKLRCPPAAQGSEVALVSSAGSPTSLPTDMVPTHVCRIRQLKSQSQV